MSGESWLKRALKGREKEERHFCLFKILGLRGSKNFKIRLDLVVINEKNLLVRNFTK